MKQWGIRVLYFVLSIGIASVLGVASFGLYKYRSIASHGNETLMRWKSSDWIYAKDFPLVRYAIVAAEDPTFISEPGRDCGLFGILNLLTESKPNCSSIIVHAGRLLNQDGPQKNIQRQLHEVCLQGDLSGNPEEAMDIVFNKTYLGAEGEGGGVYGFRHAANAYFGKGLEGLDISQAALLAAIVRSPGQFSPTGQAIRAKERRNTVIDQMAKLSFITQPEAEAAKESPLF